MNSHRSLNMRCHCHLLESDEPVDRVGDSHPELGVDGDPVAAVRQVGLQLREVVGEARVWFPAHTTDLTSGEIIIIH